MSYHHRFMAGRADGLDATPTRAARLQVQIDAMLAALEDLAADWSAEVHFDADRQVSIVYMPDGGDPAGPTLVFYPGADAVEAGLCRWDRYQPLGSFRSPEVAIAFAMAAAFAAPPQAHH